MNFLVVCTGNTCRSPMAEGLLSTMLTDEDHASSAGFVTAGEPVSPYAAEAMREIGVDISAHRAVAVTPELCHEADAIAVMSPAQGRLLCSKFGADPDQITPLNIPDPYGGDLPLYRVTRDALQKALTAWLNTLFPAVRTVPFTRRYVPAAAQIERECFSCPWSESSLEEETQNPAAHFLAAVSPVGEVLGYLGLHISGGEGMMANLAVAAAHRRKGVGAALLNAAENMAETYGLSRITLEVRPSNEAAVSLYRKAGYVFEGLRPGFYTHPTEDAAIYSKYFPKEGNP